MSKIWKRLKNIIEKKDLRKWFKRDNLIILVLGGVLLLIIAWPADNKKEEEQKNTAAEKNQAASALPDTGAESEGDERERENTADYTAALEKRLTELLGSMEGVGKVRVMITLEASEELVVEKDRSSTNSRTAEEDAEGGSRTVYQTDSREETVYSDEGRKPYVIKTFSPVVEGVVVAAQGAGTARISRDITEAVQALFGIEAHKVKVIRMQTDEE